MDDPLIEVLDSSSKIYAFMEILTGSLKLQKIT